MKNKQIYEEAMNLLGESCAAGDNEDMEERASYLLAAFCTEVSEVDARLREAECEEPVASYDSTWLALTADFPLLGRFSSSACLYLASMLVIDENPELSDKLYDRYCDSIATIISYLPDPDPEIIPTPEPPMAVLEDIVNRY